MHVYINKFTLSMLLAACIAAVAWETVSSPFHGAVLLGSVL